MNTWKVIFATVVIFVAGAFTGGLLVPQCQKALPSGKIKVAEGSPSLHGTNVSREIKLPAPMMGPLRKDFVDRLQRELNIDAAQRERIENVITDGQEVTRQIWLEVEPDIYHTIIETKDKIRAELTPEQKSKFEELIKPKWRHSAHSATNTPANSETNIIPATP